MTDKLIPYAVVAIALLFIGCAEPTVETVYVDINTGAEVGYVSPCEMIDIGDTLYIPWGYETEMFIVKKNARQEKAVFGYFKIQYAGMWQVHHKCFSYNEIEEKATRYE